MFEWIAGRKRRNIARCRRFATHPSTPETSYVEPCLQADRIGGLFHKSTDDAITQAIARASETLRNLDWFEVTEVRGHIKDGKVAHWQVGLKIGMRLEGNEG